MSNIEHSDARHEECTDTKDIVIPTAEEIKKQELVTVLAGLIKTYASKKQK